MIVIHASEPGQSSNNQTQMIKQLFLLATGLLIQVNLSGQTNDYQLLIETDNNCADFNFDMSKKLNWYGIYRTDSGEYIFNIDLKIVLYNDTINANNKSVAGNYLFWTGKIEKSEFIIGTNKMIPEHKVSHFDEDFLNHNYFLYPGESKTIYTINDLPNRKTYELNAIGCVTEIRYCPIFSNYRLRLSDKMDNWKSQDLTEDIDFKGECGSINLKWFGDIDYDGIPDLLFSSSSNSRNQMNLFISSERINDDFVKLVSRFELGNCY